jgi:hypothetical protein
MSETGLTTARDGTGQSGRMLPALEPGYVSVEERSDEDLLKFARAYADRLRFFNEKNEPEGYWSALLNVSGDPEADPDDEIHLIARYMNGADFAEKNAALAHNMGKPHLVLLLAFLQLLRHPRQQFRDITGKHLEYYYRDVLKQTEKEAVPDSLYAVFELAKGHDSCHISKGTLLDAGKDSLGVDIRYATDEDIVVNRARVSSLKTVYAGKYHGHLHTVHAASIADEEKGTLIIPPGTHTFANIPDEEQLHTGFAVASPVLRLKEGERTITVTIEGGEGTILPEEFADISYQSACPFEVSLSTGDGWLKISRPRLIAGNFIKGNADDTYDETEIPIITRPERGSPIECTVDKSDFEESQTGRCIVLDDGSVYKIKEIAGEATLRKMTIARAGRVEKTVNLRCCQLFRNALRFTLHLHAGEPAVTPSEPDGSYHDTGSRYPVIRFMLKKSTPETVTTSYYEQFSGFAPAKASIQVTVKGIQDLLLRNEASLIDVKKPFEPFGAAPRTGTGFYIAHPELAAKRLDSLKLHIEWADLPDNFEEYYKPYFRYGSTDTPITNASFNAQLKILLNQVWTPLSGAQRLFGDALKKPVSLSYSHFDLKDYNAEPGIVTPASPDPLDMDRCFKLELGRPDFQHTAYPKVVNEVAAEHAREIAKITSLKLDQALKLMKSPLITKEITGILGQLYDVVKAGVKKVGEAVKAVEKEEKEIAKKLAEAKKQLDKISKETGITIGEKERVDEEPEAPVAIPPPYVPVVNTISADYTASVELDLTKGTGNKSSQENIFQLQPFGHLDLCETDAAGRYLLPHYEDEGYLYLGISEMQPPTNVSLLYRPERGKIVRELKPVGIKWSYLAQNKWRDFDRNSILMDTTDTLLNMGIIGLSIPEEADAGNTVMPAGRHWLRVSAKENPGAVPDIVGIKTQAAIATFRDSGTAPEHLAKPLEALSVKGLAQKNPGIKSVIQPADSFNGRMKETSHTFTYRVAERLRHKQRALTGWDYERLVLEEFPQIQKAKCLNARELMQLQREQRPGTAGVVIAVIPDIKAGLPFSSREPGVPTYLLKDITDYLKSHAPAFAEPEVRNPRYRHLQYRMTIGLGRGYDPGYYLTKLNGEIREFLSPWAYGKGSEICFYTGREDSSLLRFIETREYVDFVADLKVVEPLEMQEDPDYYPGPDVILVSAPEHIIDLVPATGYREENYTGINYMIVGTDFDVNTPKRPPDSIGGMTLGEDFTVKETREEKPDDNTPDDEKEH